MKKYLKKTDFTIPLYGGELVVIITNSKKRLSNHLPDFGTGEIFAHSCLRNYGGKQGFFIVLNPDNKFKKITSGTIAHEAFHTAGFIASTRGIEPDFNNDEPLAYLIEWIVDKTHSVLDGTKGLK